MGNYEITPWKKYIVIKNPKEGEKEKKYILDKSKSAHTPDWWNKYNGVKHTRTEKIKGKSNYMNANLKNVVNSLAVLYILETKVLELSFDKVNDKPLSVKYESAVFENEQEFYTKLLAY